MKIITAASYRADMAHRYPDATWLDDPLRCDHCKRPSDVLAEFERYSDSGDYEPYRLCAACLQLTLDGLWAWQQ